MQSTDTLKPIDAEHRIFGLPSYVLMWWSSLIVIQAFVLGQGFLPPNGSLNLFQALIVVVVANLLFIVLFSLNGRAGMRYGIPFSIQVRSGFGIRGAKMAEFMRAMPAIIWYGIGSWIAAASFDSIIRTSTGFSEPWYVYGYFLLFQVLQSYLAWRGIQTLKWFNGVGSVVIAAVMIYLLVTIIQREGLVLKDSWYHEGSWGVPFWVALTGAIGVLATVMLNIGDISRHLKPSETRLWIGHAAGLAPPWFFMLGLGIISGASLGIWDPVEALVALSPSTSAMLLLLSFVLLAQFTTNLSINILPPAMIFMEVFKLSWHESVILTGVLGALSCPWLLLGNAGAFFAFILYYSAFFGPILGVMLADYYLINRGRLDVKALYDSSDQSLYWFSGGLNWAGLIAVVVPAVVAMLFFLHVSWLVGLPAGFMLYLILYRLCYGSGSGVSIRKA